MNLWLQNTKTRSRSDHLLKVDRIDSGRAIQNDSVLFLLRDEFLPNSEKFLSVSGPRRRRPRHPGQFQCGPMTSATLSFMKEEKKR
jgi:hypothetical protein